MLWCLIICVVCLSNSALSSGSAETSSCNAGQTAQIQTSEKEAEQPRDPQLEAVLQKISASRKKLKTIKADLVFERHILALDIKEVWTGKLLFKMPRLLNMELKTKDEEGERTKQYIIGEEYAWIYTPEWKQVEKYRIVSVKGKGRSTANPLEYGLAADMKEVRKVYDVTYKGSEAVAKRKTHKLELVPKKKDVDLIYSKIILWIGDDPATSGLPLKIEQHKSDGEHIEVYILSNIQRNKRISNSKFRFKKRRGISELDYTQEG